MDKRGRSSVRPGRGSRAPSDDDLIRLLDGWQTKKVVVAGDFMLDRYVYGNAERLSPDAPVPVLAAQRTDHQPGGASNVCLDLAALRCNVSCLGIVGRDVEGRLLCDALKQGGCQTGGLVHVSNRTTTVKHNFVGLAQHRHPQKMFRVDEENGAPIEKKTVTALLARARKLLAGAAVLCLEDYNKGVLTETLCQALIALARKMKVPVLVDPASISDYGKYRGATCITPNRAEAAMAAGVSFDQSLAPAVLGRMAKGLLTRLRVEAVVLTLDRHGLLLAQKGRSPKLVPTKARLVYDVTGAGDMVLAMLAASIANASGWGAAVELANLAAGLEVEKFGPVPIKLEELQLALLARRHQDQGKRREPAQLLAELAAHRTQKKRIVFANGCFDILHAGHVSLLRQARALGDMLVVAVNSDASVRRLKGDSRPVNSLDDRIAILSELQSVDYVVSFDQATPLKLIRSIRPDVLVKGAPYRRSEVVGGDFVSSYGGQVRLVRALRGRSTSKVIQKVRNVGAGRGKKR